MLKCPFRKKLLVIRFRLSAPFRRRCDRCNLQERWRAACAAARRRRTANPAATAVANAVASRLRRCAGADGSARDVGQGHPASRSSPEDQPQRQRRDDGALVRLSASQPARLGRSTDAETAARRNQERADLLRRRRLANVARQDGRRQIASMGTSGQPVRADEHSWFLQSLTQMYMRANRPADAERVAKRALTFNANVERGGRELRPRSRGGEEVRRSARAVRQPPRSSIEGSRIRSCSRRSTYEDAHVPCRWRCRCSIKARRHRLPRAISKRWSASPKLASAQLRYVKTSIATYNLILGANARRRIRAKGRRRRSDGRRLRARKDGHRRRDATILAKGDFRQLRRQSGRRRTSATATISQQRRRTTRPAHCASGLTAVGPKIATTPEALARLGQAAAESERLPQSGPDNYKRLTEVDAQRIRARICCWAKRTWRTRTTTAARDAFKASFNLAHTPDALVGLAAADQQTKNFTEAIQIYEALDKNAPAALVKANPGILLQHGQRL